MRWMLAALCILAAAGHEKTMEKRLRASVEHLAGTIGERNVYKPAKLQQAADWIRGEWHALGLTVTEQSYDVQGVPCRNLEVDVTAAPSTQGVTSPSIVLVGAHYDSVFGCPGADDNASGVAAMLEIARALKGEKLPSLVRCVAFVNEEPPWFESERMGSRVYAKMVQKRGDRIVEMLSLETIAYYSDQPKSQQYPPLIGALYPSTGNFIGVVGGLTDGSRVKRVGDLIAGSCDVPVQRAALWSGIPGVSWSDHASFWLCGYPGVMITDTAPFRNPHYHQASDKPDTLDYPRFAQLTGGLIETVRRLAGGGKK
jgi:hypothetical protein